MKKYLIIGGSTAGLSAAKTIRSHDREGEITVVSREKHLPYSKVLLTHFIAGHVNKERLYLVDDRYFKRSGTNFLPGANAVGVDPAQKKVTLENGQKLDYDTLLVATGGTPAQPPDYARGKPCVAVLRTIEEALQIRRHAGPGSVVAVIGGGPVGVKLTCALREAGSLPVMIVSSPHLLSRAADDEAAMILRQHMAGSGIEIRTGTDLSGLELQRSGLPSLLLSTGETLECNMVVFCKGVRPNTGLLSSMIEIKRGIKVDQYMRTALPDIYAAGDAAETFDLLRRDYRVAATWPHAVQQGRLAGMNMCGYKAAYDGSLSRNAMEVLGLPFISIGISRTPARENWDLKIERDNGRYRKLVYRDGRLVGALLVGDVEEAGILQAAIRRDAGVERCLDKATC